MPRSLKQTQKRTLSQFRRTLIPQNTSEFETDSQNQIPFFAGRIQTLFCYKFFSSLEKIHRTIFRQKH
ncbi:hypothetical protein CH361_12985 [Leptospira brenneri]|nr:hypothetical protein CH361_12985 [Leptospira brenneri]